LTKEKSDEIPGRIPGPPLFIPRVKNTEKRIIFCLEFCLLALIIPNLEQFLFLKLLKNSIF